MATGKILSANPILNHNRKGRGMSIGIFSSLSRSYLQTAKNSFYFIGRVSFILKPIALIIAGLYSIVLIPIACIFCLLIVFDWLGNATDIIRKSILRLMDNQSWSVDNSLLSFLFRPVVLVLIAPLFIISTFIPKLSSNALVNFAVDEATNITSGFGAFRKINEIIWRAAHRLFSYVAKAPLLLKPIVAIVAIFYSIILIVAGALFGILIPLDWIGKLIEGMRQGIVRFVDNHQNKTKYSGTAFLFSPPLLIILFPIFLIMILVPKFSAAFIPDD